MDPLEPVSKEANISQDQADKIVADYLKVVPIRDGRPLLNDIPNRLRLLADLIESGGQQADYVVVIIDGDRPVPDIYGYGDALNTREILGLLSLTSDWFARQVVAADTEHEEES